MTVSVLAAGDRFVLGSLLADALRERVGEPLNVRELELPWPDEPWSDVGGVQEAAGDEQQMIAALEGARVCVTQLAPLTRRVLEASPQLEFVGVSRGGPVNVDLEAATEQGVVVSNAPGRNATATAEFAVALLLATLRRIPELHAALARREWRGDVFRYEETGSEVEGATVGVIGQGAVGARVARILAAFGARVLAYDPYASDPSAGVERADRLEELLEQSTIVTLHARATKETSHLIDGRALALMPRGAVLVNTARPSLLDYDALFDALESGRLAAAGLDVHPEEPVPPGSRLFDAPNVVMTPHVAGASRQVAHNAAGIVAEEARRYLAGEPLEHCRNPEADRRKTSPR